jgi:hypothetical protein
LPIIQEANPADRAISFAQCFSDLPADLPSGFRWVIQDDRVSRDACTGSDYRLARHADGRIRKVRDLCEALTYGSLCALGGLTPYPVISALNHFPQDFVKPVGASSAAG